MRIPPKYKLNTEIVQLLQQIESYRSAIDAIELPIKIEQNIRRQSILKSSLYSAKIEGNKLFIKDLSTNTSRDKAKVEVFNILKAINHILHSKSKKVSFTDISRMHKFVLSGLSASAGHFRSEMNAIFDVSGAVVYLPPPPSLVEGLLKGLVNYLNGNEEKFIPIKACIAHFIFEKIHPFIDGNGRVGRILLQQVLHQNGYGMKGLLSIEEYLNENRQSYYKTLEESENDITAYIVFMLKAISETAKNARDLVVSKNTHDESDYLLPRRSEIYKIIQDHQLVTFDMVKRRFAEVNERTLRNDLKKLQDKDFIIKLGSTKGVYSKPSSDI